MRCPHPPSLALVTPRPYREGAESLLGCLDLSYGHGQSARLECNDLLTSNRYGCADGHSENRMENH